MTPLLKVKEKNEEFARNFYITPGGMSRAAAYAILSQHVLSSLPDSLGRRENLLRALVVFLPTTGPL